MIVADASTLVASLGGLLAGFFWKTRKKSAIKTIVAATASTILVLVGNEYLRLANANNVLGVVGELVLHGIGLFFYAWGTFNAGKWLGKEYNTPETE